MRTVPSLGQRLADQLRRSQSGDAWHGPSLSEVLEDVTAAQAAARPIPSSHTIWELVLHIAIWQKHILDRIERGGIADIPDELDWPKVGETTESAWRSALTQLQHANDELAAVLDQLDDANLHSRVRGKDYDFHFMLEGMTQHNLYHAGQIALLKKLV
ncbi:MAG TPA: DinB family protein [Terriglobales bacterium]|nr:DinB family protein [Terriglobales bacterium]